MYFGRVNLRADGITVMCMTLDGTEDDWIIDYLPAEADE